MSATFFQYLSILALICVAISGIYLIVTSGYGSYTNSALVVLIASIIVTIPSVITFRVMYDGQQDQHAAQQKAKIAKVCGQLIPYQFKGPDGSKVYFTCGASRELHEFTK